MKKNSKDYLFSKIYEDDVSEILHFLLYGPADIKADLLQGLNHMTNSPLVNLENLENIYLRNFFDFKLKMRLAGANFK